MKLKTLKDFGKIYAEADRTANDYNDPNVSVKELKQEAIKWAKDTKNYANFNHLKNYWRWIFMNFFNIEEEDLS